MADALDTSQSLYRPKKVLLLGNGPSFNEIARLDLREYVTVAVNHCYKYPGFVPHYHCVTDVREFFTQSAGWEIFENEKTIWVFPESARHLFKDMPKNAEVVFVKAVWDRVYNTVFDLGLPVALSTMQALGISELHVLGMGGTGHFYDQGQNNKTSSHETHEKIWRILEGQMKDIKIIDLFYDGYAGSKRDHEEMMTGDVKRHKYVHSSSTLSSSGVQSGSSESELESSS